MGSVLHPQERLHEAQAEGPEEAQEGSVAGASRALWRIESVWVRLDWFVPILGRTELRLSFRSLNLPRARPNLTKLSMAVVIRMKRTGRKNAPCYRISVAHKSDPRDGRTLETLGVYDPISPVEDLRLKLDVERARHWVQVGAVPSETVHSIFKRSGVYDGMDRSKKVRDRSGRAKDTAQGAARKAAKAGRTQAKTARNDERNAVRSAAKKAAKAAAAAEAETSE